MGRGSSYNFAYEGLGLIEVPIANKTYKRLIENPELTERYLRRAQPKKFMEVLSVLLDCPDGRRARLYGARRAKLEQKINEKR